MILGLHEYRIVPLDFNLLVLRIFMIFSKNTIQFPHVICKNYF